MKSNISRRARNYLATYGSLIIDWIAFRPRRMFGLFFLTMIAGALEVLPFAMIAIIASSYISGQDLVSLEAMGRKADLSYERALITSVISSAGIFYFKYLVNSKTLKECIAWENNILKRIIFRMKNYANMSVTSIRLPNETKALTGVITSAVRSALVVERLVNVGLHHIALVVICTFVVMWIDIYLFCVVLLVSIVFFPLYGFSLLKMLSMRELALRTNGETRDDLNNVISEHLAATPVSLSKSEDIVSGKYEDLYAISAKQIGTMNTMRLIIGFNVLIIFVFVSWVESSNISQNTDLKIVKLSALFLLVRGTVVLITLLGRLSRNYRNASVLSNLVSPQLKKNSNLPFATGCTINISDIKHMESGSYMFAVLENIPSLQHAYQLSQLSNVVSISNLLKMDSNYVVLLSASSRGNCMDAHLGSLLRTDIRVVAIDYDLWRNDETLEGVRSQFQKAVFFICLTSKKEVALAMQTLESNTPTLYFSKRDVASMTTLSQVHSKMKKSTPDSIHVFDEADEDLV